MKSILKSIANEYFSDAYIKYRAYKLLIANEASYIHTSGWIKSLKNDRPMDCADKPIPWMNYPVVSFLKSRLTNEMSMYEYGSGYSTCFYAGLVKSVVSVEYDAGWFGVVKEMVPSNASIVYVKQDADGEYCRSILLENKKYDIVLVDGRDRVNCVKQASGALTEQGILMLDDSQRDNYMEAFEFMKAAGFKALNFEGLKATGSGCDRTSIFYRENNCLGI